MAANNTTSAALAGNNLIVVLALVSLLSLGAAVLVDTSLVKTVNRDRKVLDHKQAADKVLQQDVENAPQLVASYNGLGKSEQTLADALPTTADFPGVLVTVENMAAQSGVKLKSVVPANANAIADPNAKPVPKTKADGTPNPQMTRFTVTFDSNYNSMVNFLRDLELSARPMRVVNLQLSGVGSALSGQLDIQTFYQDKATLPLSTETIK